MTSAGASSAARTPSQRQSIIQETPFGVTVIRVGVPPGDSGLRCDLSACRLTETVLWCEAFS